MGITINSKNKSIDLGYFGFKRLREKISELTETDIAEHYKDLEKVNFILSDRERNEYLKEYNAKIAKLNKKYEYKYSHILNFLYSSDCEAVIPIETCKKLYEVIKDYEDDVLYGYTGRDNCAKFEDFKEVLKDCIDNNENLEWN